jgi:hypothetical protein
MGRFSHEAVMVDPRTGYVFQTEDSGDCGLYKFVPYRRGRLEQGGKLYMLAIRRQPNLDLGGGLPIGSCWDVRWVRIDDPLATTESCFAQGRAKGGARFSRLEGAWWGEDTGFFLSTNGGGSPSSRHESGSRESILKASIRMTHCVRGAGEEEGDAPGRRDHPTRVGDQGIRRTCHGQRGQDRRRPCDQRPQERPPSAGFLAVAPDHCRAEEPECQTAAKDHG